MIAAVALVVGAVAVLLGPDAGITVFGAIAFAGVVVIAVAGLVLALVRAAGARGLPARDARGAAAVRAARRDGSGSGAWSA